MPTPLFRLDLTRHLDPVLQLARARADRVQLVAWAARYLAENTDGLDVVLVERPGTLLPVAGAKRRVKARPEGGTIRVLGAAWRDAVRRALGRESFGDVEAIVEQVTEAVELELLGGQAGTCGMPCRARRPSWAPPPQQPPCCWGWGGAAGLRIVLGQGGVTTTQWARARDTARSASPRR